MTFTITTNVEPVKGEHRCYELPGITKEIIEANGWVPTGEVSPTGYGYIRSGEEKVGVAADKEHQGQLFLMTHTNDVTHQGHFHYDKVYYKHP